MSKFKVGDTSTWFPAYANRKYNRGDVVCCDDATGTDLKHGRLYVVFCVEPGGGVHILDRFDRLPVPYRPSRFSPSTGLKLQEQDSADKAAAQAKIDADPRFDPPKEKSEFTITLPQKMHGWRVSVLDLVVQPEIKCEPKREQQVAPKFKRGDKVRCISGNGYVEQGRVYEVGEIDSFYGNSPFIQIVGVGRVYADCFELIPDASAASEIREAQESAMSGILESIRTTGERAKEMLHGVDNLIQEAEKMKERSRQQLERATKPTPPAPKFKKGDRVRCVKVPLVSGFVIGEEFIVSDVLANHFGKPHWLRLVGHGAQIYGESCFEVAPPLSPGDRVTCIDTRPRGERSTAAKQLVFGREYTVSAHELSGGVIVEWTGPWDSDRFVRVTPKPAASNPFRAGDIVVCLDPVEGSGLVQGGTYVVKSAGIVDIAVARHGTTYPADILNDPVRNYFNHWRFAKWEPMPKCGPSPVSHPFVWCWSNGRNFAI